MLETSIDPLEWQKEVERVKDKLKIPKVKMLGSSENGDIEEINGRRLQILEHT